MQSDRGKLEIASVFSVFGEFDADDSTGSAQFAVHSHFGNHHRLFSCVVALTYLRRLELRLNRAGVQRTAADVMDDMRHLHSVLAFRDGRFSPSRRLETPSKTQTEVLSALGHRVDKKGVLQPADA